MPFRIEQLKCRVTVKTGRKEPLLHQSEKPVKPAMAFALPQPQSRVEVVYPEPSQTATEERGEGAGQRPVPAPGQADARAVADRVYDLMKEEVALARLRGVVRRKG